MPDRLASWIPSSESRATLAGLWIPQRGRLVATGDPWEPYRLVDGIAGKVEAVSAYFAELQASSRSAATLRSYGMDLLRWFRFLCAVDVRWDRATRCEARDFCRWLQVASRPVRPHWCSGEDDAAPLVSGPVYAASVRAHSESVLRGFYDFHRDAGSGPILNPFPLDRSRRGRRATRTRTRWNPSATSGSACIDRGCPAGCPATSRMRSSTRSSPVCPRTVAGHWSRSMSLPGLERRSCCPCARVGSTRGVGSRDIVRGGFQVPVPAAVAVKVMVALSIMVRTLSRPVMW
jgi:hypothetical protein